MGEGVLVCTFTSYCMFNMHLSASDTNSRSGLSPTDVHNLLILHRKIVEDEGSRCLFTNRRQPLEALPVLLQPGVILAH